MKEAASIRDFVQKAVLPSPPSPAMEEFSNLGFRV